VKIVILNFKILNHRSKGVKLGSPVLLKYKKDGNV
jgi:hypothetical protein